MKLRTKGRDGIKIIDLNRRKAIRERCLNCCAWYPSQVRNCKYRYCPLYPYRTGTGKQDAKARAKAIRQYCLWCMAGQVHEVRKCTAPLCPLYGYRMGYLDRSVEVGTENEGTGTEGSARVAVGVGQ